MLALKWFDAVLFLLGSGAGGVGRQLRTKSSRAALTWAA